MFIFDEDRNLNESTEVLNSSSDSNVYKATDENTKSDIGKEDNNTVESEEKSKKEITEKIKSIISNLKKSIEERDKKIKEYEDLIKRIAADFDNFRKRSQKEKIEYTKFAVKDMVLDLLPVIDNFERAIEVLEKADLKDEVKDLFIGIKLVYKELLNVMMKYGVSRIDIEGKVFDPNISEAIEVEEAEHYDSEEGIVLKEYIKPYLMYDRVIRLGKVKVGRKKKISKSTHEENQEEKGGDDEIGGGQDSTS